MMYLIISGIGKNLVRDALRILKDLYWIPDERIPERILKRSPESLPRSLRAVPKSPKNLLKNLERNWKEPQPGNGRFDCRLKISETLSWVFQPPLLFPSSLQESQAQLKLRSSRIFVTKDSSEYIIYIFICFFSE